MKDFLYTEVVDAIVNAGLSNGLATRSGVPITWNSLRTRDAHVDVGWYDRDTERLVAAWVVRDTASDSKVLENLRWPSSQLFEGCQAVLKVEVRNARPEQRVTCTQESNIMNVVAHEIVHPGGSSTLSSLTSLAVTVGPLLDPQPSNGLLRFVRYQLPDALPIMPRNLLSFSHGRGWGVSTHPNLVTRRWLTSEADFTKAPGVPDDFYTVGIASNFAEECIFAMWGGPRRFWFREPYVSFVGGDASLEHMRQSYDVKVRVWAQQALDAADLAS